MVSAGGGGQEKQTAGKGKVRITRVRKILLALAFSLATLYCVCVVWCYVVCVGLVLCGVCVGESWVSGWTNMEAPFIITWHTISDPTWVRLQKNTLSIGLNGKSWWQHEWLAVLSSCHDRECQGFVICKNSREKICLWYSYSGVS